MTELPTSSCGPECLELLESGSKGAKWHAVIVDLVHTVGEDGRPLSRAQAWSRHYKAEGDVATTNCSRMLREAEAEAVLQRHQAARERRSSDVASLMSSTVQRSFTGRAACGRCLVRLAH